MIDYSDDQGLRVRNSQWAPEIIRLLREEPNSYFFAFGAAHFIGKHRVQKFLEDAGFKVDYVGADDPIDNNPAPETEKGFWHLICQAWFAIYQGFCFVLGLGGIAKLVSLLIMCANLVTPEDNSNRDDLLNFLMFLENLSRHLHRD